MPGHEKRSGPFRAGAPVAGQDEGEDDEGEQDRVAGTNEGEQRDAEAGERETAGRRPACGARDEPRPERERRGEERLARELVEHQAVRRIDEDRDRDEQGSPRPERARRRGPRDHRAGEQHGEQRLGEPASRYIERSAGHDRRHRRPEQHRPRQERMPVEELDVAVEVLVEVAARDQRPADRPHSVDRERRDEEDDRAERPVGEPLEPRERSAGTASQRAAQDCGPPAMTLTAGLRKRCMSWRPSSAEGRKAASSNSAPSLSCT